jgi:hypothetical protein
LISMPPNSHPLLKVLTLGIALALGACAVVPTAPTVLVLPGSQKSQADFQTDTATCLHQAQAQLAPQVEAANTQAATNAVVATAIGAATGALFGYSGYGNSSSSAVAWGAGTGLVVGSAVAGGNSQGASYSLQRRFDIAYLQCMYVHGNQVPGQASYARPVPLVRQPSRPAPPPPPQPNYPPPNTLPPV